MLLGSAARDLALDCWITARLGPGNNDLAGLGDFGVGDHPEGALRHGALDHHGAGKSAEARWSGEPPPGLRTAR